MLRLTLAQMRRSLGRLASAGLAITIGTTFVAATLLAADIMTRTTYDAVTSGYAGADLVVEGEVVDRTITALGEVPGVRSVHGYLQTSIQLSGPDGQTVASISPVAEDPALQAGALVAGALPDRPGEVALPRDVAEVLGAEPGDTVEMTAERWVEPRDGGDELVREERDEELVVVGVLDMPEAPFLSTGGVGVATAEQLRTWERWWAGTSGAPETWYWYAAVALDDGASLADVQRTAAAVVERGTTVRTIDEQARAITAEVTGDANQFTAVVLGFAGVSMLVAALVIANTFQVLVAQRTRTLALLRCVGADRSQLRRSVVLEALILGAAASVAGLVAALALVQAALLVLGRTWTEVPLPAAVHVTPAVVLTPVLVGTLVTVLAALSPAVAATRVSPLAALRPAGTPSLGERSGRVRAWTAALLAVGGALVLAGGVVVAERYDLLVGLLAGVVGGAASFVGVVLGAVFWVPRLVGLVGTVLARAGGPAARLAAANSVRNPRRTAATSAALFIGVTLVAMMATGAATSRTALTAALEEEFPVDVAVGTLSDGLTLPALPSGLAQDVEAVDGVQHVAPLTGSVVELTVGDGEPLSFMEVRAVDPAEGQAVLHDPSHLAGLDGSHVVVPAQVSGWSGIRTGDTVTVRRQPVVVEPSEPVGSATAEPGPREQPEDGAEPGRGGAEDAEASGGSVATSDEAAVVTLTAVVTELPGTAVLVTPEVLAGLDPDAGVSRLWVRLSSVDVARSAVTDITAAASDTGEPLETVGGAVERAFFQQVVDTLLTVVVALLAVAVVIALVGVTNTLSLSVLERRRENATLRAIGLSRAQLRGTLAVEGMLIAGVGAVVGAVLGTLYGWAGARTLLSEVGPVSFAVPWRDLGAVVVVALLAGLLASVLPGRSAARTSPVGALAVE
ncbi:ABC transporter permease [Actinotalea solisilvae]|uniref:ABC transporter permease n=1 Tax=Actinotalea solisilvae TaxID=2072922 RepID=UPI0018F228E7|nr:ABC transporter permease [Actinotalea solisilvae]